MFSYESAGNTTHQLPVEQLVAAYSATGNLPASMTPQSASADSTAPQSATSQSATPQTVPPHVETKVSIQPTPPNPILRLVDRNRWGQRALAKTALVKRDFSLAKRHIDKLATQAKARKDMPAYASALNENAFINILMGKPDVASMLYRQIYEIWKTCACSIIQSVSTTTCFFSGIILFFCAIKTRMPKPNDSRRNSNV